MWGERTTQHVNKVEISENFENICRSCLAKNATVNLFYYLHEGNVLCDIYKALSLLQFTENDGLPSKLCKNCADFVVEFYNFKRRTLESESRLKKMLLEREQEEENKSSVKKESAEINDSDKYETTNENESGCEINHFGNENSSEDEILEDDCDSKKTSNLKG